MMTGVLLCLVFFLAPLNDEGLIANRLRQTPDFMQTSQPKALPGGGTVYCGPAAVSNGLIWLDGYVCPDLLGNDTKSLDQIDLIRLLGSPAYMDTFQKYGTSPARLLGGLAAFLETRGCSEYRLQGQGWPPIPEQFDSGIALVDPQWLKKQLCGPSAIWLNIGWYRYDAEKDVYTTIGGHYLTLVDAGSNRKGNQLEHFLAVLDSSARAGLARKVHYVKLKRLSGGRLIPSKRGAIAPGLPRDAEGVYQLIGDLEMKEGASVCLLQGAYSLSL